MMDAPLDAASEVAFDLWDAIQRSDLPKLDDNLRPSGRVSAHIRVDAAHASTAAWWLDRLDRETRRATRLAALPRAPRRSFRPVRSSTGGLRLQSSRTGSFEAILGAYGEAEQFFSAHPMAAAALVQGLISGGRCTARVFKRLRQRLGGRNDLDLLNEDLDDLGPLDDVDAQPVTVIEVDVSSTSSDALLLPGRDFEVLASGRVAFRHRSGDFDTILR